MKFTPLYTDLKDKCNGKKFLTCSQVNKLVETIDRMTSADDRIAAEVLYLIILEHGMENNQIQNNVPCIPYNGIQTDNGIVFDIHKLPPELLLILSQFLEFVNQLEK